MISKKQKGDNAEKKVDYILKKSGLFAIRSPRTMKRILIKGKMMYISKDNDYFNLYDFIAKSKNEDKYQSKTFYIQVKSNVSDVSKCKKPISLFHNLHCNIFEYSQIWLYVKSKGFVIWNYNTNTKKWDKNFMNLNGKVIEPFTYSRGVKK